jgi:hypothetical protein
MIYGETSFLQPMKGFVSANTVEYELVESYSSLLRSMKIVKISNLIKTQWS